MSASLDVENDWNFRLLEKRLVTVKTKSDAARKIAVSDILTNLTFIIRASEAIDMQMLTADTEYLFNLKVYTSKKADDVKEEFVNFFEALDIDQSMDDFIRAYWAYPSKVRFELVEAEEP
jgi:hypothetical protein